MQCVAPSIRALAATIRRVEYWIDQEPMSKPPYDDIRDVIAAARRVLAEPEPERELANFVCAKCGFSSPMGIHRCERNYSEIPNSSFDNSGAAEGNGSQKDAS